ncbi:protein N-lysine methyltransferase METTL21A isoform X2 [Mugil cephalus]|uniref:protein N-lysine methyltransferase METTL21A isoform X2 n=1 Tax=Mugil cephalus TaxID=48193 RepID=UPI001FB82EAC|nr:protein N-lysine methyltransferase METTL21A isoform X2 [Mugil cephalus]
MPHSCAAVNCTNRFTVLTRYRGITFHRFPKAKELRKQWEAAVRRKGFSASASSMLCSEHFRPEDFDRTGQTVRIRAGVVPSVFSFPAHLQAPAPTRTSRTSRKARETLSLDRSQPVREPEPEPLPVPTVDHSYALPSSHDDLKVRLREALARVESLERERRNAKDRERRAKNIVSGLLQDLKAKRLRNEELKKQLDTHSGRRHVHVPGARGSGAQGEAGD